MQCLGFSFGLSSHPKPRCAEQGMIERFRCAAFGSPLHLLRVWSARAVGGLRSGQVLIGRPFLRQGLPNGHALVPGHHATAACADNTKHAPLPRQTRLHSRTPCPLPHIATYTFGIFSGRENTRRERGSRGEKMGFARFFTHGSAITAHSARAKAVFSGREFSTSGALPRESLRDTLNNPDPNRCNTAL